MWPRQADVSAEAAFPSRPSAEPRGCLHPEPVLLLAAAPPGTWGHSAMGSPSPPGCHPTGPGFASLGALPPCAPGLGLVWGQDLVWEQKAECGRAGGAGAAPSWSGAPKGVGAAVGGSIGCRRCVLVGIALEMGPVPEEPAPHMAGEQAGGLGLPWHPAGI